MKMGFRITFLLLLVILPVSYNGCGVVQFTGKSYETLGGNPLKPNQASQEILFAICSVLDRCQAQVPFDVCMSGVPTVNGIGMRLGLAPGVDNPYSALESAEASGAISANLLQANTCVDTINNLSCTNTNVVNAYNPSSSSPFAAVPFMIPIGACGQVFASPVQTYACSTQVFLRGAVNATNTPAVQGTGLSYSVMPALPAGLNLNSNTGVISGTPTVVTAMTPYIVTATGSQGSNQNTINIRTADGILVNDLAHDAHNGSPGTCSSVGLGTCTVRAAVEEAISSGPPVILMPAGSHVLSLGKISMTQPMDIYGDCAHGTIIDGNNAQQIFSVTAGNSSFNSMTVQNGFGNNVGGAGFNVQNSGVPTFTVTMNNVTVQNNTIVGPGPGNPDGAGIYVAGNSAANQVVLNLNGCTFLNNQNNSTDNSFGGAIYFQNNFTQGAITNSTFLQNSNAGDGGAIMYGGRSLSITNSIFYDNRAAGLGAAIADQGSATGNIILINDTFDSNSAATGGGAITMQATNYNIVNCIFANNSTSTANNGGAFYINGGTASLGNSLFLNNLANGGLKVCNNSNVNSTGNNLSDSVAGDCNFNQSNDIVSTQALLGPLQDNGGSTQTMAFLPGSPGIGQANTGACPSTDQRGYTRHLPTSCDIGPFEQQP